MFATLSPKPANQQAAKTTQNPGANPHRLGSPMGAVLFAKTTTKPPQGFQKLSRKKTTSSTRKLTRNAIFYGSKISVAISVAATL